MQPVNLRSRDCFVPSLDRRTVNDLRFVWKRDRCQSSVLHDTQSSFRLAHSSSSVGPLSRTLRVKSIFAHSRSPSVERRGPSCQHSKFPFSHSKRHTAVLYSPAIMRSANARRSCSLERLFIFDIDRVTLVPLPLTACSPLSPLPVSAETLGAHRISLRSPDHRRTSDALRSNMILYRR